MPHRTSPIVHESPEANGVSKPDNHGLSIAIETITPAIAASWLRRGGKNRKLVERRVDVLVAAIHRGEWRLTGDSVKLDFNGAVRDGQHRLQAVVKAGLPITTLVVRGVDEAAFDVMDTGRSRSIGDVLGMHGYAFQNAVAGAIRILMFMERFGQFRPNTLEARTVVNSVTSLAYAEAHPEIVLGLQLGDRVRKAGLQGGVSVWGALFTLFLRKDAEAAYRFSHFLITGEDMTRGHPALVLRSRLLWRKEGEHAKSEPGREQLAAMTIKAWNAYREGKSLQMLYWRADGKKAEAFPVPQ